MIYEITEYNAKCDRCEKQFSKTPYQNRRSLFGAVETRK